RCRDHEHGRTAVAAAQRDQQSQSMAQAKADWHEIEPERYRRADLRDGRRTPPTAGGPEPIEFLLAKRPPVALRPWIRHGSRCRDLLAVRVEGGLSRREIEPDPDTSGGQGRAVALACATWRRHSCLPRRHSCRRLLSTLCHAREQVSRRVSTRQARVPAPHRPVECEKCSSSPWPRDSVRLLHREGAVVSPNSSYLRVRCRHTPALVAKEDWCRRFRKPLQSVWNPRSPDSIGAPTRIFRGPRRWPRRWGSVWRS